MADPLNPTVPGLSYSPYPPEMQQDAASIRRRQALVDMLMMRAMQPMQMPSSGGIQVPVSPFAGANQIAGAAFGGLAGKKVEGAEKDLAGRYSSGLAKATAQMNEAIKQGDYATASQISSKWPTLKTISEKLFERGLPKHEVHGDVLMNMNAQDPLSGARPTQTFAPANMTVQTPTGPTTIPGQQASLTRKTTFPPANITNVQNFPENKAATTFAEKQAALLSDKLKASHDLATQARGDLSTIRTAVEAYNQGVKTGSFAGLRNELDKFAETAGFKSQDPKISNTDIMLRTMAQRILAHTKELRPLSDPDRRYLEDILAGKGMDAAGIERLFQIGIEGSIRGIYEHNNLLNKSANSPGALPSFREIYRVELPTDPEGNFRIKIGPEAGGAAPAGSTRGPIPASQLTPAQIKAMQEWLKSSSQTAP